MLFDDKNNKKHLFVALFILTACLITALVSGENIVTYKDTLFPVGGMSVIFAINSGIEMLKEKGDLNKSPTIIINNELYRFHRGFFWGYSIFFTMMLLLILIGQGKINDFLLYVGGVLVIIAALHYFAASGVKKGASYGRILSNLIAIFLFIGFPVGTIIGIYIFTKTGKKWQPMNQ